jgi:outer membrane biosynthesis protein TonB
MRLFVFTPLLLAPILANGQATDSGSPPIMTFSQTYVCRQAEMPIAALRKGVGGRTEVAFKVNEDASFSDITVTATAGESREHKMLDTVAREHVKSCKYVGPNPKPTPGVYRVALVWKVE